MILTLETNQLSMYAGTSLNTTGAFPSNPAQTEDMEVDTFAQEDQAQSGMETQIPGESATAQVTVSEDGLPLQPKRQCPTCKGIYIHLEAHIANVHSTSLNYKCQFCDRKFVSKELVNGHVRHAHILKYGKLKVVRRINSSDPSPARTTSQSRGRKPRSKNFHCSVCNVSFCGPKSMELHNLSHKKDPNYRHKPRQRVTRISELESKSSVDREGNAETSADERDDNNHNLNTITPAAGLITRGTPRPRRSRKGQLKSTFSALACPYETCPNTFQRAPDLKKHLRDAHPEFTSYGAQVSDVPEESTKTEKIKATCPECGKLYLWNNLRRHVLAVHRGKRPFHCTVCDKWFQDKEGLKLHQTTKRHKQLEQEKMSQETESVFVVETVESI